MSIKKNVALMIVLMFCLIACQPRTPGLLISATATDLSTVVPTTAASTSSPEATPTSTFTPEATPTLFDEELDSFQFESIKMFADNGTGDIEAVSGWAVALLPDGYEYILHTEDGGQTWNHPIQTSGINSGMYFFLSSQTAWNVDVNTNQLQRTLDGGQTWQSLFEYSADQAIYEGLSFNFWDADHGRSMSGLPAAGTAFLKLNGTHDSGATWERLTIAPPWEGSVSESGELALCNLCSDRVYDDASRIMILYGLTADQTLQPEIDFAISIDEGKTWTDGRALIPDELIGHAAKFGAFTFFDDQHGVASLWSSYKDAPLDFTEYSTLFPFYTSNGGITWSSGTPAPTADIDETFVNFENFLSPTEAILRCADKLCVTHDGAQSWKLIQPNIEFPRSTDAAEWLDGLDFIDPNLGFAIFTAADATNLYRTSDGGMHWTQIDYQLVP